VGASVGDESAESCGVVSRPHIPLLVRAVHRVYVVVRQVVQLLCDGHKWVS